jgi:hypothetical protein
VELGYSVGSGNGSEAHLALKHHDKAFLTRSKTLIWLADVTYIANDRGWLFVATGSDLYCRKIVRWAITDYFLHLSALNSFVDG